MKRKPPDGEAAVAPSIFFPARRWISAAAPALLVIGVWLMLHPYRGIVHDARLYAVQALRQLNPEIFDRDLFFAFGSQDEFTLFTALFAPLVAGIGMSLASLITVAVGHALWLSGAAALALRLAPSKGAAFAGLLLVAALPSSYGGWQVLAYGEGFVTPRLLAEGLALWGLWALSRGNYAFAAGLAVGSGALHPIMCLVAVLVGMTFLIIRDRRWIVVAIAGALVAAAAAYLGIGPLGRLAQTMDPEWLAVVEARNTYLFQGHWRAADWSRCAIALALVLATAVLLTGWRRSLLLATAVTTSACLVVNYVAVDLLHNVLLIQLQLYRALWLLNVIAYLGAGILLVRLWALREDGQSLVALLAFGGFLTFTTLPPIGAVVFAAGLALAVRRLTGRIPPLSRSLQLTCLGLAAVLAVGLLVYRVVSVWAEVWDILPVGLASLGASVSVTVIDVAVVAVAALLIARYWPATARAALPALAVAMLVGSLLIWDRRDPWTRTVWEDQTAMAPAWDLPPDAEVFWENDAVNSWRLLNRPSYVSSTQGAGIGFARDTALTFRRRVDVVQPLMQTEMVEVFRKRNAQAGDLPDLDRATLAGVCGKDPALSALVLSRAVDGSYAGYWDPPVPYYSTWLPTRGPAQKPVSRFYLYLCDDLRQNAPTVATASPEMPEAGVATPSPGTLPPGARLLRSRNPAP
jgi:hypothetical protein